MLVRRALSVSLLMLGLLTPIASKAQLEFPQPKGWVNDFSNVISAEAKKHLTTICAEVDQKAHAQIAVVTVDTTADISIEDYALGLFNKWGIGHKEDNRGILILLSITDRKYRIEVGRGFEPLFPNDRVAQIGAQMLPDLRQRRYAEAILHTADEIASIIAKERGVTITNTAPSSVP